MQLTLALILNQTKIISKRLLYSKVGCQPLRFIGDFMRHLSINTIFEHSMPSHVNSLTIKVCINSPLSSQCHCVFVYRVSNITGHKM